MRAFDCFDEIIESNFEANPKRMARIGLPKTLVSRNGNRSDKTLRIGFVPLIDCAPIILAHETGLYREYGLEIALMREPGWATIRDKMAYGELDAAHAPVGLAFALNWGLGVLPQPCLTGYLLNSNADAISVSRELYESGVTDPDTLAVETRNSRRERPLTFGVPHQFSTHHFHLLQWMRPAGIIPGRDIQIVVLPPSLMPSCLAAGDIDGFCVGEPFNTLAAEKGNGVILAQHSDLSLMHPEKALLAAGSFEDAKHDQHIELIRATAEAARRLETHEGRAAAVDILSQPRYLGLNSKLIKSSLSASESEADGAGSNKRLLIFSHPEVNRPTNDKGNWLLSHMRNAGLLEGVNTKAGPLLSDIFREDLFEEATVEDYKVSA